MVSLPGPPDSTSEPPWPTTISLPGPPEIWSLPSRLLSDCPSPTSTSLPPLPEISSLPPRPTTVSPESVPLRSSRFSVPSQTVPDSPLHFFAEATCAASKTSRIPNSVTSSIVLFFIFGTPPRDQLVNCPPSGDFQGREGS